MAVAVAALEATVPGSSCYIAELKSTADLEPGFIDPALLYHTSTPTHRTSITSSTTPRSKDDILSGEGILAQRSSGSGGGGKENEGGAAAAAGVGSKESEMIKKVLSDAGMAALTDLPNFSPGFLHSPLALAAGGGSKRSSMVGTGSARQSSATGEGVVGGGSRRGSGAGAVAAAGVVRKSAAGEESAGSKRGSIAGVAAEAGEAAEGMEGVGVADEATASVPAKDDPRQSLVFR